MRSIRTGSSIKSNNRGRPSKDPIRAVAPKRQQPDTAQRTFQTAFRLCFRPLTPSRLRERPRLSDLFNAIRADSGAGTERVPHHLPCRVVALPAFGPCRSLQLNLCYQLHEPSPPAPLFPSIIRDVYSLCLLVRQVLTTVCFARTHYLAKETEMAPVVRRPRQLEIARGLALPAHLLQAAISG